MRFLRATTAFFLLYIALTGTVSAVPNGQEGQTLTVQRSEDRRSAVAVWVPDPGIEYQVFFAVARTRESGTDPDSYEVDIDTLIIDWPLDSDIGRRVVRDLDPRRTYIYGVIGVSRDDNGEEVWGEWQIVWNDTPAVSLALDTEASVTGYWSDGTANVEVTVSLKNVGKAPFEDATRITITCGQVGYPANGCRGETSIVIPDGYGPVSDTITLRVPTGEMTFTVEYGMDRVQTLDFSVPERILGVNHAVWECFSDKSNVGADWEEELGIGCAGWAREFVHKWDQSAPVTVSISGPGGFAAEFRNVLNDLSPVVNLQFEWVGYEYDADISAYVGITVAEADSISGYCVSEVFGCHNTDFNSLSDEILGASVIIYNLWPELGVELDDFDDTHRSHFRSAMLHEAVHVLSRMNHRAELLSVMSEEVHHRAELNPMDEALLRLHGHPLVEPGMTMSEIEGLIVFNDELEDPQPPDSRFASWYLVSNAYEGLRQATSAQFSVRYSSPGCSQGSDWFDYQVGNPTGRHPYLGWVRIETGSNHIYAFQPQLDVHEYWSRSQSGWMEVGPDSFSGALPGWRGDLADPHHMLESVLYYANWSEAEMIGDADGRDALRFELDMNDPVGHSHAENARIVLAVDRNANVVVEYGMEWTLDSEEECDTHLIEAKSGRYGLDFEIPDEVRLGSPYIENCEVDSLGSIEGSLRLSGHWARECGTDVNGKGYSRPYRFSLHDWSFARFELSSADDISLNILSDGGSPIETSGSGYLLGGHGTPEGARLVWAHTPLSAGEYTMEVVSHNRALPTSFMLVVTVQPTPAPPYRFRSISASASRTCGLLLDGTPLCWGARNTRGGGSVPPAGKFASISSGSHVCALRVDGTPVCWDFGGHRDQTPPPGEKFASISVGWTHACALREDGTPVCWGSNQYEKATPPAGEKFTHISSGTSYTCALREDGSATCWGGNLRGEASPPADERFVSISAAEEHTCGLREDGSTVCWGGEGLSICKPVPGGYYHCYNAARGGNVPLSPPDGEVFESLSTEAPYCALRTDGSPACWTNYESGIAPPPEGERFTTITAISTHACGLRADGVVVCWGRNRVGQASPPSGVNYPPYSQIPQAPVHLVSISSGRSHTCALDKDRAAICWGPNWWSGRFQGEFDSISSGEAHTCGLRPDGSVLCKGSNDEGQSSPPPDEKFASVSSGSAHTCGLRVDGTVSCWGDNHVGQAAADGEFAAISAGYWHTCGLSAVGSISCWGLDREGQSSPTDDEPFTSVSAGGWHTCALRADETAVCWGADAYGQASPPADERFVSLSSGGTHTCGIRASGTAVCWGANYLYQAMPRR